MKKILLLTRSNLKKNRGTSIGLFLLMLVATCLVGISLLIFLDACRLPEKEAARLGGGDGFITVSGDLGDLTDEQLGKLIEDSTESYYMYHNLAYQVISIPFGDGNVGITLVLSDSSAFARTMNTIEVIEEDAAITGDYVYLPYQFNTSGGFEIGDRYEYEYLGKKYSFTVKGFTNIVYGGCNNNGRYEFVIDDDSYAKISAEYRETLDNINIVYTLKDGVKSSAFRIKLSNDLLAVAPNSVAGGNDLGTVVNNRSFMGFIIAVSMLVLTSIIVIAAATMLANSILNYIKENMKTIGALKAVGYTGKDLRSSLIVWFAVIALSAGVLGIALSYCLMPLFSSIVVGQMGIPYHVSFNGIATFVPIACMIVFTMIVTLISSSKITKIQPIVALREGLSSHNFRKNRVRLDRTRLGLNSSLAVKTLFGNMKQNVITFFVTGLMVFICVIALLMYENFNRNPKLGILATEICAGVATVDNDTRDECLDYLNSREDIKNIREIINLEFYYNDEEKLFTYIVDDASKLNNQRLCYKGRLPKYDNEVVVSGSFAKAYGFEIGDEITLDHGEESYTYLITGFIQTTNNDGREALFTYKAAEHVVDMSQIPAWYWFDLTEESSDNNKNIATTGDILEEIKDMYGDHVVSTMNFYDIVGGSMTTFKDISAMMLIMMCAISVAVIGLILFLLIKALVYHKRKDYGIYKALGYTSGSLMLQTALSFMPAIILSVVVFSIVSYFAANPYMMTFMHMFGLMECDFAIPVLGVALIGAGLVAVSFALALLQTRRIKKIEAINMLVAE